MQEISREDARDLVKQVQVAHRLAAGFYQRILPILDEIANKLDLEFVAWEPLETELPKKNRQPGSLWAWDFLPMYCSEFGYSRIKDQSKTDATDVHLSFLLSIDQNFHATERKSLGLSTEQEPDAVSLKEGNAIVRALVFRPTCALNTPFDNLFDDTCRHTNFPQGKQLISDGFFCVGHQWELTDFLSSQQDVIKQLQKTIMTPPSFQ